MIHDLEGLRPSRCTIFLQSIRSNYMKVQLKFLLLITLVVSLSACGGARLASGKQHNRSCASNF